jgi:hypothetical protein
MDHTISRRLPYEIIHYILRIRSYQMFKDWLPIIHKRISPALIPLHIDFESSDLYRLLYDRRAVIMALHRDVIIYAQVTLRTGNNAKDRLHLPPNIAPPFHIINDYPNTYYHTLAERDFQDFLTIFDFTIPPE